MKALKALAVRSLALTRLEGEVRMVFNPAAALRQLGWFRSVREKRSVDAAGGPLPWITYPAIEFVRERLSRDHVVFEYGCGSSTRWFASRSKQVYSVEHHGEWLAEFSKELPKNAEIIFKPLARESSYLEIAFTTTTARNEYSDAILSVPATDVVVIDGVFRNACVAACCDRVGDGTVVIYDNTDFEEAKAGVAYLRERGWRQLRFVGLSPILDKISETSVFYKTGNCWGI